MTDSSNSDSKEEFAKRLYRLMLKRGMTQSDLARESGLSRGNISTYVRGTSLPKGLFLQKIADALSVELDELLPEGKHAETSPFVTRISPDGRKMHIKADIWLPTSVGAQIVQLLAEHGPLSEGET